MLGGDFIASELCQLIQVSTYGTCDLLGPEIPQFIRIFISDSLLEFVVNEEKCTAICISVCVLFLVFLLLVFLFLSLFALRVLAWGLGLWVGGWFVLRVRPVKPLSPGPPFRSCGFGGGLKQRERVLCVRAPHFFPGRV